MDFDRKWTEVAQFFEELEQKWQSLFVIVDRHAQLFFLFDALSEDSRVKNDLLIALKEYLNEQFEGTPVMVTSLLEFLVEQREHFSEIYDILIKENMNIGQTIDSLEKERRKSFRWLEKMSNIRRKKDSDMRNENCKQEDSRRDHNQILARLKEELRKMGLAQKYVESLEEVLQKIKTSLPHPSNAEVPTNNKELADNLSEIWKEVEKGHEEFIEKTRKAAAVHENDQKLSVIVNTLVHEEKKKPKSSGILRKICCCML